MNAGLSEIFFIKKHSFLQLEKISPGLWLGDIFMRVISRAESAASRLKVWNLFAYGKQIMRAADCKPFVGKMVVFSTVSPPGQAGGFFYGSEQTHLAGFRHTGESTQGFELFDVGFTELVAGGGEFLDGDELLALALFHGGQRRRLAQTVH